MLRLFVLLALLGAARPAAALDCHASSASIWPEADWGEEPARGPAVDRLLATAFAPDTSTNGLVVVEGGRIIVERYAHGFDRDRRHISWSVSKSVLHAVYGTAVAAGLVDIDRPVAERSPWVSGDEAATYTYRHLLRMSSGLDFNESYEFAPLRSSVIAMLYTLGRADMARFAAGHDQAAPPGTRWSYKSGDSLILAAALRDVVGADRYPDYPWTALFDPLGIRSAVWERDASGTFVGSSYLYAAPRDLARIGLLYARDGCWGGRRVLPEGWVADAMTPAPALDTAGEQPFWRRLTTPGSVSYGAHWWLNRPSGPDAERAFPDAPDDLLLASGHWGQRVVVVPSLDLVIVRTANDRGGGLGRDDLIRLVLAVLDDEGGP